MKFQNQATHVGSSFRAFSDGGSTPPASTKIESITYIDSALKIVPNRAAAINGYQECVQMLNVQRRHRPPCTRAEWDRRSCAGRGPRCQLLIRGTQNGSRVQLSAAKFLPPDKARDLETACALALEWERAGKLVVPPSMRPFPRQPPDDLGNVTVERAVAASKNRGLLPGF
jgi:hypothetical protein